MAKQTNIPVSGWMELSILQAVSPPWTERMEQQFEDPGRN